MTFRVVEEPDGCHFIAQIQLRIGPLAAKLNKKELGAVRQHMKVEGENIKRMLEAQSETSAEDHPPDNA